MPRPAPRTLAHLALVLALPLSLAHVSAHVSAQEAPAGSDGSLEAFLRRARAEGEAERARLRPRVEELVRKLGQARSNPEITKLQAELEGLGSEALPMLVPFLDPGTSGAEPDQQARQVAEILFHSGSPALFDAVLAIARSGSPRGRPLAIRVLGASREVERAQSALRALHPSLAGPLRAECVRALAHLAPEDPLVLAALSDPHADVVRAGLRALTPEARKEPRPEILALLSDPSRAADVLDELVDYFCAPGQALDEDIAAALIAFAARADLSPAARLKVLEGLPRFGVSLSSRLRKELEPVLESSDSAIKDGALVAMTLMKDSRARRELMRVYDEQVKKNESWPLAYQRRGDIEYRIGEYHDAARDYQNALRLHGDSARLPGNRDLWVNLARAQIKDNKLKSAFDSLTEYGPTSDLRRQLRADPDFQPLVEHPRYRSVLE